MSIATSLAMLIGSTSTQTDPPLAPTTSWRVEASDTDCALSRTFGTGDDQLVVALVALPGGPLVDLAIVENGVAGGAPKSTKLKIVAGPGPAIEARNAFTTSNIDGEHITRGSIPREDVDRLHAATQIELRFGDRTATIAPTGADAALAALARCESGILKHWGLDPQIIARAVTKAEPRTSPANWTSFTDYPMGALRRGEQGRTTFRLDIDAKGKVQACVIITSSGSTELDDTVCNLMRGRARFKPARDASGVAVPSIWTNHYNWRIPSN